MSALFESSPGAPRYTPEEARDALERGEAVFAVYAKYPCFPNHLQGEGCAQCKSGALLVLHDRRNENSLILSCPACGQRLKGGLYDLGLADRKRPKDRAVGPLRPEVLQRERCRCFVCGAGPDQDALEIDHVIPFARGGPTEILNLITLCERCNQAKRAAVDYLYIHRALTHTHFHDQPAAKTLREHGERVKLVCSTMKRWLGEDL